MIVKVKNPELYVAWQRYYERTNSPLNSIDRRTWAYLNSEAGRSVPWS